MQTRDYHAAEYKESREVEDNHPGVLIRGELSSIEAPEPDRFAELLYTAVETGVIEGIDVEDAVTVWRLMELARRLSPDRAEMLRM